MKRLAITFISLVILGLASYYLYLNYQWEQGEQDYFSTWKSFTPRSQLFQVLLPSTPQYGKESIAIPNSDQKRRYDMYLSEKVDGTLFLISVISYPSAYDISSHDTLRQLIEELRNNNQQAKMNQFSQTTLQGYRAIEFDFENQTFETAGMAIRDDHVVYMLTYTTQKENFDDEEFEHFIHSFKILKQHEEFKYDEERTGKV